MQRKKALQDQMHAKYPLCSKESDILFEQADDFHDADLNKIFTSDDGLTLLIRHPSWSFLDPNKSKDFLTAIRFYLAEPIFSMNWGSDDEIRRCMIYNFFINSDGFDLLTGDGGRSGALNCAKSTVEIFATREIFESLGFPH